MCYFSTYPGPIPYEELSSVNKSLMHSDPVNEPQIFDAHYRRVERDLWIHSPLWVEHSPEYRYLKYMEYYAIMGPYEEGFCIGLGEREGYLCDENGKKIYVLSLEKAKGVTYDYWSSLNEYSLSDE